jgi:hypothetical protein
MTRQVKFGTFTIRPRKGLWVAVDTCTFNNWGRNAFVTLGEALAWAERADAFKRGKRQTVEPQPWELA